MKKQFKDFVNYIKVYADYKKSKWTCFWLRQDARKAYKKISVYVGITGFAPKTNAKYQMCSIIHKRNKQFLKSMDNLCPGIVSECSLFYPDKNCSDNLCSYCTSQNEYVAQRKRLKTALQQCEQSKQIFNQTKNSLKQKYFQRG